ncbi:MAG: tetratricopeptide repeat protein [Bacteroidota bacterium]
MKNRKRFIFPVLFILSIAALAMKKFMVPFHGFVLILIFDGMAILYFMQAFRSEKLGEEVRGRAFRFDISSIAYAVCSIAILYRMEYWNGWEGWVTAAGVLLFIVSMLTFFSISVYMKQTDKGNKIKPLLLANFSWIYFMVLFPVVALTNPRTFHNLFNGTTYEEYVRNRYPLEEGTAMLNLYKPGNTRSKEIAEEYFTTAIQDEKDDDLEEALLNYNRCIDLNPDNAQAYYKRGRLKLTRLEIDNEMAQSACNDFARAIQLDPNMAPAYYSRAVAYHYIFPKDLMPARTDLLKAKMLDTSLNSDNYLNNFLAHSKPDSTVDTTASIDLQKDRR